MKILKVKTEKPYGVIIGNGVVNYLTEILSGANAVLTVADETVFNIYGRKLNGILDAVKAKKFTYVLPSGETGKSKYSFDKLIGYMAEINLAKDDCVIAFGGGATSDVTGFACSVYKRGIPYVNVPTTLLAMADASVGGKTAIDLLGVKNAVGSFYQPKAVVSDLDFLQTLSQERIRDGIAEIIKCAVIGDEKLFNDLNAEDFDLEDALFKAVKIKAKTVKKDERDEKVRKKLNFGHTIGHAIESEYDFKISHGEAVALGMIAETEFAEFTGIYKGEKAKLVSLIKKFGFDTEIKYTKEKILKYIGYDKKRSGNGIVMPLPKDIGKCVLCSVKRSVLEDFLYGCKDLPL